MKCRFLYMFFPVLISESFITFVQPHKFIFKNNKSTHRSPESIPVATFFNPIFFLNYGTFTKSVDGTTKLSAHFPRVFCSSVTRWQGIPAALTSQRVCDVTWRSMTEHDVTCWNLWFFPWCWCFPIYFLFRNFAV